MTVRSLGERPGVLPILDAHLPESPTKRDRAWYVMPLAEPLAVKLEAAAKRENKTPDTLLAQIVGEYIEVEEFLEAIDNDDDVQNVYPGIAG